MPADVNGTINIIAEVVGNNQSPSKAGSILEGRNKKQTDANRKGFLEMVKHSKTLRFIMFGLVTQSSVMSTTLGALVRLLGILLDSFLMPLVPLLKRGMDTFSDWVLFIANFEWPEDWGAYWQSLIDWWNNQWETKGGLVGIIKELFLDAAGVSLLSALFATFALGPRSGLWVLQNTFGTGAKLTVSFLKGLLGWTKTAAKTGGGVITSVLKTVGTVLLSTGGLLKKLFGKTPVFLKKQLHKAWGLARMAGASVVTLAWRGLLFAAGPIMAALSGAGGVIASVWSALGLGSALAALGVAAFWVILIGGLIVTSIWISNALMNRVFGKGLWEVWNDFIESLRDWAYNTVKSVGDSWEAGMDFFDFDFPMPSYDEIRGGGT